VTRPRRLFAIALWLAGQTALAGTPVPVKAPLGLPPVPVPQDNPLTREKIDLGRKLFFDRRLSPNNTMSCAMCHVPEQGFTSNELGTAIGIEGQTVRRSAPTLYNAAYMLRLFHDGREFSLENQVWGPLLAGNEMGNPAVGYVIERIRGLDDYRGLFERAFGQGPSMGTIGMALASYERTLVSGNSRFDRWYFAKERDALSAQEREGFRLFSGKAGCGACHTVGARNALFTDQGFHNTGVGYARGMGGDRAYRVQLAPGEHAEVRESETASYSEPPPNDVGRFEITLDPADRWAYRTPALRNVALTAPYMHDGSIPTLEEVVEFYDKGGVANDALDPRMKPLGLTDEQKRALVAFLKALTGDNVEALIRDARRAAPGS